MADLPRILLPYELHNALVAADVIRDGEHISRVVIDAKEGEPVRMYVERFGDERLLHVAQTLEGVQISGAPSSEQAESKRAVRYWVLVSDELMGGAFEWPAGLRPVERGGAEQGGMSWWLFEDDTAPPEVAYREVELRVEQTTDGVTWQRIPGKAASHGDHA
jgi:hypothetical protein